MDPAGKSLQFHRIDRSRDTNFWSVRASRDLRLIVHKTGGNLLLAYVGHHDDAYIWAERRRIEAHPKTGAVQIVEVRERVEEISPAGQPPPQLPPLRLQPRRHHCLPHCPPKIMLAVGVPADWVADVQAAGEDAFFTLAEHLPAEAAEALLQYASTGRLPPPTPRPQTHSPTRTHSAASVWSKTKKSWRRRWTPRGTGGRCSCTRHNATWRSAVSPGRRGVSGSAGTGKTVVALHRAANLGRQSATGQVLLTTFSAPLCRRPFAKAACATRPGLTGTPPHHGCPLLSSGGRTLPARFRPPRHRRF